MKPLDYIIIAAVVAAVVGSLVYIARRHKQGKCAGCGGDCSKCNLCDRKKEK